MTKILHISKYYYPYYGGIEDVAHTIIEQLKGGYEQRIICFNHERGAILNENGANVLRVGVVCTIASQPISLSYRGMLKKIIAEFRPDFIHLHLPNPLIANYLLTLNLYGAKIISHWHADILGKKCFYPFYQRFEKKILDKSHKIIATSKMYQEHSLPLRSYKEKTCILQNTVEEKKLILHKGEEVEVQKIKEKYEKKKIVFFVGRHVAYKGIDKLIKVVPSLKEDCVVLIAGTGVLTDKLKKMSIGEKKIHFVGRLSNNDLKYHLHAADLFAFPSVDRREAFGVALVEALYCGIPAVSFDVKGSGVVWVNQHNKTGLVVENGNVKAYGKAIDELLKNEEKRTEFSQNAKQWIRENFMKDKIRTVLEEVYQ